MSTYVLLVSEDRLEEIENNKKFNLQLVDDLLNNKVRSGPIYVAGKSNPKQANVYIVVDNNAVDLGPVGSSESSEKTWFENLAKKFGYILTEGKKTKRGRKPTDWNKIIEEL